MFSVIVEGINHYSECCWHFLRICGCHDEFVVKKNKWGPQDIISIDSFKTQEDRKVYIIKTRKIHKYLA